MDSDKTSLEPFNIKSTSSVFTHRCEDVFATLNTTLQQDNIPEAVSDLEDEKELEDLTSVKGYSYNLSDYMPKSILKPSVSEIVEEDDKSLEKLPKFNRDSSNWKLYDLTDVQMSSDAQNISSALSFLKSQQQTTNVSPADEIDINLDKHVFKKSGKEAKEINMTKVKIDKRKYDKIADDINESQNEKNSHIKLDHLNNDDE